MGLNLLEIKHKSHTTNHLAANVKTVMASPFPKCGKQYALNVYP